VVETTIDVGLQKRAQMAVETMLAREGTAAGVGQAALVILDTTGGIRALVGGRSFAESQFNRAVKARRQPGSAFKPLVYLAAIEQGMTADTVVLDSPIDLAGWSPRNEDGRYRGPTTLRQALAHSVNTVAVRLQQEVGAERVATAARRLGIASRLRPDASMALGTSEVGLLELAGTYAVLAAGGAGVEPHAITRVRLGGGPAVYERHEGRPRMVVAPDTVGIMSAMLNAVIVSGTGRRAAMPRHQAAGKTGTSQDFRDAWFLGYTAHLIGGVWLGNDDGAPMSRVSGGGLPAELWRTVMTAAHEGLTPKPLPAIDLARDDPAPAPVAQTGKTPSRSAARGTHEISATAVPVAVEAQRRGSGSSSSAPRGNPSEPRLPSEPIDPELFRQALGELADDRSPAVVAPEPPTARATAVITPMTPPGFVQGFDAARIREALGRRPAAAGPPMGLGMGK
jgi:penicillin-binding protein 1A